MGLGLRGGPLKSVIITYLVNRPIIRTAVFVSILALLLVVTVSADDFDPERLIFHYHGPTSDSHLGGKLTALGDINGDGYDDIAMSCVEPRLLHIFYGGNPVDSIPDMLLVGGNGAAAPVDLDGDGIDDLITKATYYEDIFNPTGVIYFFKGYGDSLGSVPYDSLRPEVDNCGFGQKLVTGYVDGDNLGDFVTYKAYCATLYYYGGCPATDTEPEWQYEIDRYWHYPSDFGFIDFDGDGWQDIYVGMIGQRDSFSYVGVFTGPDFGAEPDVIIEYPREGFEIDSQSFADAVANYGDVNGDGWEDLGVVFANVPLIYLCGPGADTLYDYVLSGTANVISPAGDINGDGYNDLLGGQSRVPNGVVDLYYGGPSIDTEFDLSVYRWNLPPLFLDFIGFSLSPAGDFNGDGCDDYMFGCKNFFGGDPYDVFMVAGVPEVQTDVDEPGLEELPEGFNLYQNYPNPFNASTRIEFSLSRADEVTVAIYNVLGRRIRVLVDGRVYPAGSHVLSWDGRLADDSYAPSGVYFYEVTTSSTGQSRKMVLIK